MKYYVLNDLLEMIDEPNGGICRKVLEENEDLFRRARGSSHNHQAWKGGYLDHVTEVMNIARLLYKPLDAARRLPFSLSDVLLVLYLHDVEKPWRYTQQDDGTWVKNPALVDKEKQIWPFVQEKIRQYGFVLTEDHWNGIKYVEGEKGEYAQTKRTQGPLAAFAHMCDTWSARGWFNFPAISNDPWSGAQRGQNLQSLL